MSHHEPPGCRQIFAFILAWCAGAMVLAAFFGLYP